MANAKNEIIIQFKAEAADFNKEIKSLNDETKNLNKAFALEQEQLKKTGTEAEKLESRMEYLAKKHEIAEKKVKATEDQLQKAKDTYGESSKEVEILENKLLDAKVAYEKIGNQIDDTGKKLDESRDKWKKAGKTMQDTGDKLKDVGGKMTSRVTAPIVAGFGLAVKGTEELRETLAKLETNAGLAGISVDEIRGNLVDLSGVSEDTDANVEALSNLMAAGFNGQGMSEAVDALSGAVIKFPDTLKIEGLADGLQETLATGEAIGPFAELIDRMGGSTDDFNAKMAGAKTEADKMQVALDWLAESGLGKVNEEYRKNNEEIVKAKESNQNLQLALADLGEVLAPIVTKVTDFITGVVDLFNNLSPTGQTAVLVILGLIAAIGPLLSIIGTVISIMGGLTIAATGAGIGIGAMLSPILLIIGAIALIIAAGVLLWKNWDTIKAKASELWGNITQTFENIKTSISGKIEDAKEAVRKAIEKIKGFFDFKWSLPKLKMPTFGIKGKFSLNPPSIPKLSVNWNAEGGIFTKPTIFNTSAGLQGVGEAGPEAILPLSKLAGIMRDMMPDAYASTATGRVIHEVGGNLNLNLSGANAGALNTQAIADTVLDMVLDNISKGNRAIPNRMSILPF